MSKHTSEEQCKHCGRRGWDLRGLITILGIVLVFALAFTQMATSDNDDTTIAPWAAGFLLLVVNNYYSSKSAERMVATMTKRPGENAAPEQAPTPSP